jgi:glycosyltransferase involved in cell wall biosynthesis
MSVGAVHSRPSVVSAVAPPPEQAGVASGVSVVIPVYRSEQTLSELHRLLSAAMAAQACEYEIILVEDGGGDRSWSIIERLAAVDHHVRGIRLSRNYGQHNALLCGIREARFDVILTMDDDLQQPASEIGAMLAALRPEYDVVYGAPQSGQHGILRNIATRLTKTALASVIGAETAGSVSAFRVFRTRLRDGFAAYRSPTVSIDVLLSWTTTRFAAIKVGHAQRSTGKSGRLPASSASPSSFSACRFCCLSSSTTPSAAAQYPALPFSHPR